MPNFKDISGGKFNRLTAIEVFDKQRGTHRWKCLCDCGNTAIVKVSKILNESTKSCGCLNSERSKKGFFFKHGLKKTMEYNSWTAMKDRCYNPNNNHYKSYGARGIIVCDKWKHDFMVFLSDMGKKPGKLYSIERENVNGNYEPSNCFWLANNLQGRNKTNNHYITLNGETKIMADWCIQYSIDASHVSTRLKRGWIIDERLFSKFPIGYRYKK